MADSDKLNTFLADHSFLGSDACATQEDYRICASVSGVVAAKHPHLARWHAHVTVLAAKYPTCDWRGSPVPAGTNRLGGAAAAAPAKAPAAKDDKKGKSSPKASPKAAPAAAPAGAVDESAIKAVGDDIRILKERLKGEGITGKKLNDHPEVAELVKKLSALKEGGAAPAAASAPAKDKKAAAPKPEAKKASKKDKDDAEVKLTPEQVAEERKKQMKKVIKEGGKRGVEIEGAADMGGLQFFCTSVDEPQGDIEMLDRCMEAMNEKSDPTEEERKGGSGAIGKMIFSCATEHLAVCAYVPEAKQGECSCEEWLKAVLANFGGVMVKTDKSVCIGKVLADGDKNIFPLKIREPMILEANNFLRKRGLFPEDNGSDSDEMVFGDDDFPSM